MRKVKTNRRNRIFGLFAMFAMAIGVGVSLAPREVVKVKAATTYTETFDGMTMSGSSYGSGSHMGAHGVNWTYSDARGDLTMDGKALLLRAGSLKTTITEGLSKIMFDYDRAFTGTKARSYKVYANDELLDTITVNATANERKTYISTDLEYEGSVSIEIEGIGAQKMIDNVVLVTYDSGSQFGTLDRITLDYSAAKTNFVVMETYSSAGLKVTAWDAQDNSKEVFTATTDYDEVTFGSEDKGSHTVTVSYTEGVTKTATYPITVTDARLFTEAKASELNIGATYTIVDPSTGMAIGAKSGSFYSNIAAITVDGPPKAILDNDDILEFELEAGSKLGSYAFKILNTEDAGKYISYTGSSNALYSADTVTDASSWNVTDTNVTNVGSGTRIIKYNPSAPRFAAYTSGQNDVKLYVDETTMPNPDAPSVVITSTDPRLSVGGTATLVATTENAEGVLVSWSSSNELVATINSSTGLVTGVAVGSATITAKITVDEVDYTHTLVITIVPAYINADIATILEGDDVKTVAYTGIARIKGWNTSGADSSAGKYGNMLLVDLIGGAEIAVYGATANQSALVYSGTTGEYTYQSQTSFLTDDLTKDLAVGDVIEFVGVRGDYKGVKQLNLVILSQVSAYDEAEVFANWLMDHESGDIVTLDCEDKFSNAWDIWDTLSADAQDSFMNHADFADAVARIRMWAAANGFDWDAEFVLDGDSYLTRTKVTYSPERTHKVALIIGILGLTSIVGFYYLKKRKVI